MSRLHDVLDVGLRWLYDTAQPDGALTQGHGPVAELGDRTYRFAVQSHSGQPVVIVNVLRPDIDTSGTVHNPLETDELSRLGVLLERDLHEPVEESWNGHPGCTGSILLSRTAHPALLAALRRYHNGCPVHRDVLCGQQQSCSWFADGDRLMVRPVWPALPPLAAADRAPAERGTAAQPRNASSPRYVDGHPGLAT